MNELLQNKRMYFETSAVNYMYNEVFLKNGFDPEKTGKVNERRNCQWLISDITLWEIFLTKDKKLRDSLFDFSKLLFHKQLIMSPEELIVKFIDNGCPILENGFEFYSNGVFAPEWYKSCTIPDYYFEPADYDSFRNYAANIRNIGKSSLKLGKLETNSKNNSNPFIVDLDGKKIEISGKKRHSEEVFNKAFMDNIYNKLISEYNNKTNENIQYVLVSMNVALTILCYGTGINRNIIDAFWNRIGVYNPYKRLLYTANNYLNVFLEDL